MTRKRTASIDQVRCDADFLRERCRPLLPVRLYIRPTDALGYCELRFNDAGQASHFNIVLDPQSYSSMWQTLVHEWAHALAWREGHETVDDHGPEWALALAHVYQELVEP